MSRRGSLIFFVVFFFVFISAVHATTASQKQNYKAFNLQNAIITVIKDATTTDTASSIIIPLLVLTASLIIGSLYVAGHVLNQPQWKVIATTELWHLLFSVGLLVGFGVLVVCSHLFFKVFFQEVKSNIPSSSSDSCFSKTTATKMDICYINEMQSKLKNIVLSFETNAVNYQRYAALYIAYYGLSQGTTVSKLAYRRAWALMLTTLDNLYVLPVYVSLETQKLLIQYLLGATAVENKTTVSLILGVLLPIALLCRFIPVLRQVGNFFFALAIVVYAFVPFILSVTYMMYSPAFNSCNTYQQVIQDTVSQIGNCSAAGNLYNLSRLYPYAVLYPNLVLVLTATFTTCLYTLLNRMG